MSDEVAKAIIEMSKNGKHVKKDKDIAMMKGDDDIISDEVADAIVAVSKQGKHHKRQHQGGKTAKADFKIDIEPLKDLISADPGRKSFGKRPKHDFKMKQIHDVPRHYPFRMYDANMHQN